MKTNSHHKQPSQKTSKQGMDGREAWLPGNVPLCILKLKEKQESGRGKKWSYFVKRHKPDTEELILKSNETGAK